MGASVSNTSFNRTFRYVVGKERMDSIKLEGLIVVLYLRRKILMYR